MKKTVFLCFLFLALLFPSSTFAQSNSFVSIVNPVRGEEFWDKKDQEPVSAVRGQLDILKQFNLSATFLLRFDALDNQKIIDVLRGSNYEKGIFLEVTPSWSQSSLVKYHQSSSWHQAGSAFLTGYEINDREKLIDTVFEKFKKVFGHYPQSVGAWWIDAYSLEYMERKYGITAVMIVADQYSTDNYQIWGQYWSTPYYPSKRNALHPAQNTDDKLPIVMMQWAGRDPVNAYGNGVFESTFSVQANDYLDFHDLDTNYFSKLVDIYTKQPFNQFNQLVVGLENSYSWQKFHDEYKKQVKLLVDKKELGQFQIVTMKDFASWYKQSFPNLSPEHLIIADDPLNSDKKVVWFMNPYFRAGWFFNQEGSVFRDIRQYVEGEQELCYQKACNEVNFATFATRVLDEVTFGHKWIIDQGKIKDFKLTKKDGKYLIIYTNEAGKVREIGFLPKDISIDDKIWSIDTTILNATVQDLKRQKTQSQIEEGIFKWSAMSVLSKVIKFSLFLIIACIIPGLVIIKKLFEKQPFLRIFLATIVGLVNLTLIFYVLSLLGIRPLIFLYLLVNIIFFIRLKFYLIKINFPKSWFNLMSIITVLAGSIFLNLPMFKNGLLFPYGLGFWGPNTHDGIWHLSLINQLIKSIPVENPIFAQTTLKNYHYLYDLLIAATTYLSAIPPIDLFFRLYPIILSLMLGIGSYYLIFNLFKDKLAVLLGLYFVYFAGSFGWIVSYIKDKTLAGESAFWTNQSISFNLNPPFAISLLIVIALLHILSTFEKINKITLFLAIILTGSLIGFKAYGAVLILGSMLILGILKRQASYILVFIGGVLISAAIFFANFQVTSRLLIFAPFWFIHSMVDSPDRVGWVRLSLAREAGLSSGNWFKFMAAEAISFVIFLIGNLGMRVFALLSVVNLKTIFEKNEYLFLFIFSTVSLFIPIIFIQEGNPWNTIQFLYYGLYIGALVAGVTLSALFNRLPKPFSILLITIVLILTPINSVVTASYYTPYLPHARIDPEELRALEFLSKQKDGTVLTYPYDRKLKQRIDEPWPLFAYDSTAYVSALSKKVSFVEDEPQNQILLTDYKKRLLASRDFFSIQGEKEKRFLKDNNIKYIYLPKIFNLKLNEQKLNLKNIFENDQVLIYQVID